jgi:hypothetical protein
MPSEQGHAAITLEQAKALVAGRLGTEMAKFPVRFCKPAYFGAPPSRGRPAAINNGTVTLLNFRGTLLAITCHHVIEGYRRKLADYRNCFFAMADCHFDPLSQIIAEDDVTDAAVIRITAKQAAVITRNSNGIGEAFYSLNAWPPEPVKVGDFVAYAGFPGDLRERVSFDGISFGSYSSGACRVTDQHADYLTCEFEREYWIKNFAEHEPESLGGLSGGPTFVIRHSTAGIISYEFAGVIYRMHESTESLYIRQARAISLGL